jgi:hypothetical protein
MTAGLSSLALSGSHFMVKHSATNANQSLEPPQPDSGTAPEADGALKPALPEPPYEPYARKPAAPEPPYEPYKGL